MPSLVRRLIPVAVVVAVVSTLGSGCGARAGSSSSAGDPTDRSAPTSSSTPSRPVSRPTAVPAADGPVTTGSPVTVLDDGGGGGGAELCLGGVATSYPPQCGGPALVGWDWTEHAGDVEEANGVRWGEFVVEGTFDGRSLSPTEVVAAADWDRPDPVPPTDPFVTPCDEPAGGWVVDASRAGEADNQRAFEVARRLPGYASSFVDDRSRDPRSPEQRDQDAAEGREPAESVAIVNVAVTGDPEAAEARIREVWGGGLCLTTAERTEAELRQVEKAVYELPGFLFGSQEDGGVLVDVVFDDGASQAWADATYGTGVVTVTSALTPLDP